MRTSILTITLLFSALTIFAQCDPAVVPHYNMGDFPFTSSTGVTVTMSGTNSGVLGPYIAYGCSPATCDVNTIRLDPGDTLIFTFSQTVYDITFITGVMNTTENGKILTNNGIPTLSTNCPVDQQITGNAFAQVGPLASPVLTVTIPGGATSISIVCLPASTNGVFTIDLLDCINQSSPCTTTTSNLVETACDTFNSPSGIIWTSSGSYMDTIPNVAGCDSVISIDLTILNSSSGTVVQTACQSFTWIDGNTYTTDDSTATFTLTNAAGCDSVVTLNLTINSVDTSVTQSGVTLTSNATGAIYQWLDCQSMLPISGDTNQLFTAPANGNYAVAVTENGCTDTSACFPVIGVGIIENDFGIELLLYPNPTDGNLSVNLGAVHQNVTITLLDLNGKLIQSKFYSEGQEFKLKLDAPAGVYLLKIDSNEKNAVIRLVKELN